MACGGLTSAAEPLRTDKRIPCSSLPVPTKNRTASLVRWFGEVSSRYSSSPPRPHASGFHERTKSPDLRQIGTSLERCIVDPCAADERSERARFRFNRGIMATDAAVHHCCFVIFA